MDLLLNGWEHHTAFSVYPAFLYAFLRNAQGITRSRSKDQSIDLHNSDLNWPSKKHLQHLKCWGEQILWIVILVFVVGCNGVQWRCECMEVLLIPPNIGWKGVMQEKVLPSVCSMEEGKSKGKKDRFLTHLARARRLLFLTVGGAGWDCFWNAATGEGAKHPLKMQNSASDRSCTENE